MSNYKDMVRVVDALIKKNKPFLIIKYCSAFLDRSNNTYEIVTISRGRLRYLPINRNDAICAIRKFELPLLHELDNRNMIWGDKDFREAYKKKGVCL